MMEENNELHRAIYEYFKTRILFGTYRYGEQLISVPQICASFKVARNTVQSAMEQLEMEGYIKTEDRKVARVTYWGNEEIFRKNAASYFVPRRDGILDFVHAGELFFQPMWEIGMPALIHNAQNDTDGVWNTPETVAIPVPSRLYFDVLRTFNNELLLGLYWQCLSYLNFLYPAKNERTVDYKLEKPVTKEKIDEMKVVYDDYFDNVQNQVLSLVDKVYEKDHLEPVDQIPFKWTIYRRRPQLRYTLAATLIREILCGHYPMDSYLPSLPRLAEQYHVSVSTIRRTLDVLHGLGVTKAQMGIGIKVCLEPVDMEIMKVPEIRENLRLHGEAMEILALTVRGVILFTLGSVASEKREVLLESIHQLHGKNNSILCIDVLLGFIARECPSAIIRECYGKLRELAAWGYIFSTVLKGVGQLNIDLTDFISGLELALQNDHRDAFAEQWQRFMEGRRLFLASKFPDAMEC